MTAYRVVITREGDSWLSDVPDVPGAHTYSRTLAGLLKMTREVIILMDDLADDAPVDLSLDISDDDLLRHAVELSEKRAKYAAREAELQAETAQAARDLTDKGISVRDSAALLGLTPGRISQLTNA